MRITRETLLKIAKDTVKQRVEMDRSIVAAFLTGSMLDDEPFLGGTTDIDLLFVFDHDPNVRREIVRLGPEVHLDIASDGRSDYDPPRKLRAELWRGYALYDPMLLYERQHFFEYTQAIVRSQFDEPANVAARVRRHYDPARRLWMELQTGGDPSAGQMARYFQAIHHAAQAVAGLSGGPLTERRLLLKFPARAQAAGRPELYEALLRLLGGSNADAATIAGWLPAWQESFILAAEGKGDERIHPARLGYYKQAIEALAGSEQFTAALWPLLRTWTTSAVQLPADGQAVKLWREAFDQLGLLGPGIEERLQTLDRFLDTVEEIVEGMAPEEPAR